MAPRPAASAARAPIFLHRRPFPVSANVPVSELEIRLISKTPFIKLRRIGDFVLRDAHEHGLALRIDSLNYAPRGNPPRGRIASFESEDEARRALEERYRISFLGRERDSGDMEPSRMDSLEPPRQRPCLSRSRTPDWKVVSGPRNHVPKCDPEPVRAAQPTVGAP